MIKNLLLTTLLTNLTYLGYFRRFTNSRMFIDLLGIRKEIALHNLNNTIFYLQKALILLNQIWFKFNSVWLIAPRNKIMVKYFDIVQRLDYLDKFLYLWGNKWKFGFLTNAARFLSLSSKILFPAALIYINYTGNFTKLIEGDKAKLLQIGLSDSNSLRFYYNYLINANEKTARSYLYFSNIFFLASLHYYYKTQRLLLF